METLGVMQEALNSMQLCSNYEEAFACIIFNTLISTWHIEWFQYFGKPAKKRLKH